VTKLLVIGGTSIAPGERKRIYLDVAKLYDFTDMNIPIEVVRGKEDRPVLFVRFCCEIYFIHWRAAAKCRKA
jgi:uncharacterized protein